MRERPIIFTAESVHAILEGRKTQTRRVMKPQPTYSSCQQPAGPLTEKIAAAGVRAAVATGIIKCPYGQPGDRLWVKEPYRAFNDGDLYFWADCIQYGHDYKPVHADDNPEDWRWQSPMLMPRCHSRLTLEIVKVRAERVQEISEADANAEGCPLASRDQDWSQCRRWYQARWDSINTKRAGGIYAWDKNPWVWILETRETKGGAL